MGIWILWIWKGTLLLRTCSNSFLLESFALGWWKLPVTCPLNFIPILFQFTGIWFQVSGVRCQDSTPWASVLTPRIKLRLPGTVKRLNVEHRTSNIERRILMTLRFNYFKTSELQNTEPQPATSPSAVSSGSNGSLRQQAQGLSLSKAAESNFEGLIRVAQSFF